MAIRVWGCGLLIGAAVVGCNGGSGSESPTGGDGGASSSSGGSGGSGSSSGAGSSGSSSGSMTGSNSTLSATMQQTGRHGADLVFSITGNDPNGRTTEAHVKLLDATSHPVIAFDTNWDGAADSAEQRLHFDQSTLGQKSFKTTITLPGLYKIAPSISSAVVELSDASGNLSAPVTTTIAMQPLRKVGDACDTSAIVDRCAEGTSCSGTPAVCVAGVAPTLTRIAYYGGTAPAELFLGSDPDEDVATLNVAFQDGTGKPISVNLSGDSTPASSFTLNVTGLAGQTFFYENDPVAGFASVVPKISVTPTDAEGRAGMPVVASLSSPPTVGPGLACDPYGFSTCVKGYACSPGMAASATNKCISVASLQTSQCTAAPQSSTDPLAAWGTASGVSLWDPPTGCAATTAVGHPESVVTLKLTHTATTLTLSTALPETNFDTILYVLPTCTSTSTEALGCSDDAQGYASTLTLNNVPPGTYTVVIDSAGPLGGTFGLSVSVQ